MSYIDRDEKTAHLFILMKAQEVHISALMCYLSGKYEEAVRHSMEAGTLYSTAQAQKICLELSEGLKK